VYQGFCDQIAELWQQLLDSGTPVDERLAFQMKTWLQLVTGPVAPIAHPSHTWIAYHTIYSGPPDGLRRACEQLVADFDILCLQTARTEHSKRRKEYLAVRKELLKKQAEERASTTSDD